MFAGVAARDLVVKLLGHYDELVWGIEAIEEGGEVRFR